MLLSKIKNCLAFVLFFFVYAKYAAAQEACHYLDASKSVHHKLGASSTSLQMKCEKNILSLVSQGKLIQQIEAPENGKFHTSDINHDGYLDLVVTDATSNLNKTIWVWFFDRNKKRFNDPQEIAGFEFFMDKKGFVVTSNRSSASSWTYSFYKPTIETLSLKFEIDVTLGEDKSVTCEATENRNKNPSLITAYIKKYYCTHYDAGKPSAIKEDYLQ